MPKAELRLYEECGGIYVQGRASKNHQWWYLLKLTNAGKLKRCTSISPELGFDLDHRYRISLDAPSDLL